MICIFVLGVVVEHLVKTLPENEIKNDKELSCIRVRSRHVSGDIIWAAWPWTRFAWRETTTLPPGLYKWESCGLNNHAAHTDSNSSKSRINLILAVLIWLCHPKAVPLFNVRDIKKKNLRLTTQSLQFSLCNYHRPPVLSYVLGPNIFHTLLVLNKTS
jgi:hypothetical protein